MEDEDSKTRRNIVAFASAVILLAWLKVPMDVVTERLLGVGAKSEFLLSQRRVWIAAAVVLAYLALRYRFSEENKNGISAMKEEWAHVDHRVLGCWLKIEAACINRWNNFETPLLGGFKNILTQVKVPLGEVQPKLSRCLLMGYFRGVNTNGTVLDHSKFATAQLRLEVAGTKRPTHQLSLVCPIGPFGRVFKFCIATLWLSVYSRASLSFFAPWVLAVLAGCLIARRLWQIW